MEAIVKNGDKSFKEGKKELKTGLFKWKPDYNAAAPCFEEAAKTYRKAKAWEKSLESYDKAAFCNKELNDTWGVARALEGSIEVLTENPALIKSKDQVLSMVSEASQYFIANDAYSNAQKLFIKVADYLVKEGDMQTAIEVIKQGYEDAISSEKKYVVSDIINYYIDLLVQNNSYSAAIDVYKQQIKSLSDKKSKVPLEQYGLLIICLCLIGNEFIRAQSEITELGELIPNFFKELEYQACQRMLQTYESGDQEEFTKIVSRPPVNLQFPVIIPRLVKKVQVKQMIVEQQGQGQQVQQTQEQLEKMIL